MATIQQIKQQITRQEQQFEQARQQLAQAKTRIPVTRQQLLKQRGIASREKIREAQQTRTKQIQQARQKLKTQEQKFKKQIEPVKKQISSYESAVARQQSEAAEWKEAVRLARGGTPEQRLHIPKSLRKKREEILGGATPPGTKTVPYDPGVLEKYQKQIEAQKIDLDLSGVQVPKVSEIPEVFKPQDLPFDIKQTYQVGVDTSGKPVYSTKQPDVSYAPPVWSEPGKHIERYVPKEFTSRELEKIKHPITTSIKETALSTLTGLPRGIDIIKPETAIKIFATVPSPQERVAEHLVSKGVDFTKIKIPHKVTPIGPTVDIAAPVRDIAKFEEIIKERKETGQRQKEIQEQVLSSIDTAETYEEQMSALKDLREIGGDYEIVDDEIRIKEPPKIDTSGTIMTLGKGVTEDFIGGTKFFSELVTKPLEKQVEKLPYKVREEIAHPFKVDESKIIRIEDFGKPDEEITMPPIPEGFKGTTLDYGYEKIEPLSIQPQLSFFGGASERIKGFPSILGYKLKHGDEHFMGYKEITGAEEPSEIPGMISKKLLIEYPKETGGYLGETFLSEKYLGSPYMEPFKIGPEIYGKDIKDVLIIPGVGRKVGEFAGTMTPFFLSAPATLLGGATITFAPKSAAITREERLTGAFLMGAGAFKYGVQGLKYAKQKITIPAEFQPRPIGSAVQVTKPTRFPFLSKAKLKMEVIVPGRKYAEVPRYATWFYKKPIVSETGKVIMEPKIFPKLYKTIKPTSFIAKSKTYVVSGEGVAMGKINIIEAVEQRVGAKQKLVLRITGETGKITEKDWVSVPKKIKDLLRKAVQEERGGLLLSDVRLKEYLRMGKEVSYAPKIKVEKLVKYKEPVVDIKTRPELIFDIKTKGRKIVDYTIKYEDPSMTIKGFSPAKGKDVFTKMASITETKPVLYIGTKEGFGEGAYRGITAIGKTKPTFVKELVIQKGWQGSQPFSLKPSGIKTFSKYAGKKSSKEYIASLYKDTSSLSKQFSKKVIEKDIKQLKNVFEAGVIKSIPKPSPIPKIAKPSELIIDSQVLAPLMVGGEGKGVSEYLGKSVITAKVYEETFVGEPKEDISTTQIPQTIIKLDTSPALLPRVDEKIKITTKVITKPMVKEIVKPMIKPAIKPVIKEIVKPMIKPMIKPLTRLALKPVLKPALKPMIKQTIIPGRPTPPTTTPKIPFVPIPIIPKTILKKKKYRKKKQPKRVILYGRRRGKFMVLGKPTTFEMARRKGIGFLKKTLAATIELRTPEGERLPIGEVPKGFRFGKKGKDIKQLIQMKEARLETRGERLEIIRARKGRIKFI